MTTPTLAATLVPLALTAGLVLLLSLRADGAPAEATMSSPLEPWLKSGVAWLAWGTEIAAGIVVGAAVLRASASFARRRLTPEQIRQQLGRNLALGLDFTITAPRGHRESRRDPAAAHAVEYLPRRRASGERRARVIR